LLRPQIVSAGAVLVTGVAGRARIARYVALVFSDVLRVLLAVGGDFADGGRVVTVSEACPGSPHPTLGFSMVVEVCRGAAWLFALGTVTAV
jgi:hypothetical protein